MVALEGIGAALERLRVRKLGKDNYALASRATRVDASSLGKYERETRGMTLQVLGRILDGYHASLSDLAEELARVQGAPAGTNGGGQANVKSQEEVPEWGRILQRLIEHIDERLCVLEAALVADDHERDGDGEKRRGNGGA